VRGTSGDVQIDRNNTITTTNNSVREVIVTTTVSARTHGNDPLGLGHLLINTTKRRSHLVGKSTSDNHDISLTRRSTENDTETIEIISRRTTVHHFYGATSKTESDGPHGGFTSPVHELIDIRKEIFSAVIESSQLVRLEKLIRLLFCKNENMSQT
jgi:hypothetical protein